MSAFKVPFEVDEERESGLVQKYKNGREQPITAIHAMLKDAWTAARDDERFSGVQLEMEMGIWDLWGKCEHGEFYVSARGNILLIDVEDGDEEAIHELLKRAESTERSAVSIEWAKETEAAEEDWDVDLVTFSNED